MSSITENIRELSDFFQQRPYLPLSKTNNEARHFRISYEHSPETSIGYPSREMNNKQRKHGTISSLIQFSNDPLKNVVCMENEEIINDTSMYDNLKYYGYYINSSFSGDGMNSGRWRKFMNIDGDSDEKEGELKGRRNEKNNKSISNSHKDNVRKALPTDLLLCKEGEKRPHRTSDCCRSSKEENRIYHPKIIIPDDLSSEEIDNLHINTISTPHNYNRTNNKKSEFDDCVEEEYSKTNFERGKKRSKKKLVNKDEYKSLIELHQILANCQKFDKKHQFNNFPNVEMREGRQNTCQPQPHQTTRTSHLYARQTLKNDQQNKQPERKKQQQPTHQTYNFNHRPSNKWFGDKPTKHSVLRDKTNERILRRKSQSLIDNRITNSCNSEFYYATNKFNTSSYRSNISHESSQLKYRKEKHQQKYHEHKKLNLQQPIFDHHKKYSLKLGRVNKKNKVNEIPFITTTLHKMTAHPLVSITPNKLLHTSSTVTYTTPSSYFTRLRKKIRKNRKRLRRRRIEAKKIQSISMTTTSTTETLTDERHTNTNPFSNTSSQNYLNYLYQNKLLDKSRQFPVSIFTTSIDDNESMERPVSLSSSTETYKLKNPAAYHRLKELSNSIQPPKVFDNEQFVIENNYHQKNHEKRNLIVNRFTSSKFSFRPKQSNTQLLQNYYKKHRKYISNVNNNNSKNCYSKIKRFIQSCLDSNIFLFFLISLFIVICIVASIFLWYYLKLLKYHQFAKSSLTSNNENRNESLQNFTAKNPSEWFPLLSTSKFPVNGTRKIFFKKGQNLYRNKSSEMFSDQMVEISLDNKKFQEPTFYRTFYETSNANSEKGDKFFYTNGHPIL
ncbi:hypothetical protein SNEBB_001138 [Seison nebaliae]|nr:hypothetical protein SNEBB_001138 [Seison nebaliae]